MKILQADYKAYLAFLKNAATKYEVAIHNYWALLRTNPYQNPPPYEKLVGDLTGAYSRRINIQHRLVYQVIESEHAVKILRMWTHYE